MLTRVSAKQYLMLGTALTGVGALACQPRPSRIASQELARVLFDW